MGRGGEPIANLSGFYRTAPGDCRSQTSPNPWIEMIVATTCREIYRQEIVSVCEGLSISTMQFRYLRLCS